MIDIVSDVNAFVCVISAQLTEFLSKKKKVFRTKDLEQSNTVLLLVQYYIKL